MNNNQIREQVLTATMLQSFQFFQPKNIDADPVDDNLITWGNYSFSNDIYPDVHKILIQNSPTATSLIKNISDFITCNLTGYNVLDGQPFKQVRHQITTKILDWSNTIGTQVEGISEDMLLWRGSFAVWVGYDLEALKNGKVIINQFKRLPVHWLRYIKISEDLKEYYDITDEYFVAQKSCLATENSRNESNYDIYFPFNPNEKVEGLMKHISLMNDVKKSKDNFFSELLPKNCTLKFGQVFLLNNSGETIYPDCVFDGLLQLLLADIGVNSGIATYLATAKIAQTFQKNDASSGAEMMEQVLRPAVNNMMQSAGFTGKQMDLANSALSGYYNNAIMSMNPGNGTGFGASGVLAMGSNISVRIQDNESIKNFLHETDCANFMDEFKKIKLHIKEELAERMGIDYAFAFKSENGLFNQENLEMITKKANLKFDKQRDIIEYVFNDLILSRSIFPYRISLKALGEGKTEINEGIVK